MKYGTHLILALAVPLLVGSTGCSSSSSTNSDAATDGSGGSGGTGADAAKDGSADLGPAGGPVAGPADNHCQGKETITPVEKSCHPDAGAAAAADDGGVEEPETHNNAEADDDDCKYHLSFSSDPIHLNQNVTFTVKVVRKANGQPEPFPAGADLNVAGVTDNDTHPFPNAPAPTTTVMNPGTFKYGPVKFDKSGDWKITFHIREDCADLAEDSPHGHATFLIRVP
jgi:hypothetical protein